MSSSRLPNGFLSVQVALDSPANSLVNIIGVVEHLFPPAPTKGTDWQFTFGIQDESVTSALRRGTSLKVKYFTRSRDDVPKIQSVGDVVLLRALKLTTWAGKPVALSRYWSECIVFPSASIVEPHFKHPYACGHEHLQFHSTPLTAGRPTPDQQVYVISLHGALPPILHQGIPEVAQGAGATMAKPKINHKYSLISKCGPAQFFDLAVEVVKKIATPGNSCEVYVTDYTENNLLYLYNPPDDDEAMERDGDQFNYTGPHPSSKWKGPFGQMTLQVKLWDPHARYAMQNIREGDYVWLKNVHVKMDRSGSRIEGALHQDSKYISRVDIHKLSTNDPRYPDLEKRKQSYLARLRPQPKAKGGGKSAKRKEKKQRLKDQDSSHKTPGQMSESEEVVLNPHVRSERPNDPVTSIAKIHANLHPNYTMPSGAKVDTPFTNAVYRARVRVVEFFPDDLEDFAHSLDDPTYNNTGPDGEDASSTTYSALSQSPKRWEWAFFLLVEDAKQPPGTKEPARIPVMVAHEDAEYLLRTLDATDLHKDKKRLAELKEKLFIMWGNLEELKSAGENLLDDAVRRKLQSKPFECCIKEYGVPEDTDNSGEGGDKSLGWVRKFRLCGTSIT